MTDDQKRLLMCVAAEAGVSSADMSPGEMQIANTLIDDGVAFWDLTLRLTNAGWDALEKLDVCN